MSGKKTAYKYCIVPNCKNTSRTTPNKIFIGVPRSTKRRRQWCEAIKGDRKLYSELSNKSTRYCCEDHFELEKDVSNYSEWKIMGGRMMLSRYAVPHLFKCQEQTFSSPAEEDNSEKPQQPTSIPEETGKYEAASVFIKTENNVNDCEKASLGQSHNEGNCNEYMESKVKIEDCKIRSEVKYGYDTCVINMEIEDDLRGYQDTKVNIKIEPVDIKLEEEDAPEYVTVSCEICSNGEPDSLEKCGSVVIIENKPAPMGIPNRPELTLPKEILELRSSCFGNKGVFALKHLKPGVRLGPYEGRTHKTESGDGYIWKLLNNRLEDDTDETFSNFLRYVNNAEVPAKRNLEAFQYNGELYFRTCSDIYRGDELLQYFGKRATETDYKPLVETISWELHSCPFCHISFRMQKQRDHHQKVCKFRPDDPQVEVNIAEVKAETFQCKFCQCSVTNATFLAGHERCCSKRIVKKATESTEQYPCNLCDYVGTLRKNLKVHQLEMHRKKNVKFTCNHCSYETYARQNLVRHNRVHTAMMFRCEGCGKGFQRKQHLDAHLLIQHPELKHLITNKIHQCDACQFVTLSKVRLGQHLLMHSKDALKPYACDQCPYRAVEKWTLDKHLLIHSSSKPWHCSSCIKGFTQKIHLDSHILHNHYDDKALLASVTTKFISCPSCDFRTIARTVFQRHVKKHDKIK